MQIRLPTERTLSQWLQALEALQPERMELGLQRISEVASRAGLLDPGFRVVTVAGTNGKGSTLGYIARMLQCAGLRVGSYTSPHFLTFNERISIDGRLIGDAELVAALDAVERARGDTPLTYFEFTTLAAAEHFRRQDIDIAVLEVGLGGRLDAVNLWHSEVACVTSIGIDHVDWLGDDRESIGREKAAVARAGCALVCGDAQPPASIAEVVATIGARLVQVGRDYRLQRQGAGWRYIDDRHRFELPAPAIASDWAYGNAATAISVCSQLFGARLQREWIVDALAHVQLAGRAQRVSHRDVEVVVDVAHNAAAAEQLAVFLSQNPVAGRTRAVFGCMQDKDAGSIVASLSPCVDGWYIGEIDYGRALSGTQISNLLTQYDTEVALYPSVTTAFEQAVAQSSYSDRVVVFGSFLTVAEVMRAMDGLHTH